MTKAIQTILVPTDFSDNAQAAFAFALQLAGQLQAQLHVLHVQDESALRFAIREGLLEADSSDEQLQAQMEQIVSMRFSTVLAGTGDTGIPITQARRRGHPHREIIEYAEEIDADLLVVGKHGLSAMNTIASIFLGSVSENVLNHSPRPVLVVRLPEPAAE